MALDAKVRATIENVARRESKRPIKVRAKVAFSNLRHHHPKAVRGVKFSNFYSRVCTFRHVHGISPKRPRRPKHDRKKAVNPPPAVNEDLQDIADIITFLASNDGVLATYERLKANMPSGLKIEVDASHRPKLALDN